MNLVLDPAELRPLIEAAVAEVVANAEKLGAGDDRLAFPEVEAAKLLGIAPHQLRDARLREEIVATKVGGRIGYERTELLAYLARGRSEVR